MKEKVIQFLRWTEKYTETDMLYAVKGGFWIMFGKIGIFLIAFLKMLAFGRWLDQEIYGIYSFIISMVAILTISSLPGIETSLVKAIAKKKEGTLDLAVKERIKYSLLGSFASLVAASWYFYNQNVNLGVAFIILAIFLPFQSSFKTFSSFWIGRKDFEKQSKYSLASGALVASVMIPVIIFSNNPIIIVLAFLISHSIFEGIFYFKTSRQKTNNDVFKEAIIFGKSLTIIGAINQFAANVDKIILWKFFGPVQLAIYSFAQVPIQQIRGAIPITYLALPKIGENGAGNMKEGIIKKFKKLFFLSIPLAGAGALIAPLFYRIVLPQYVDSIPYFQAFCFLIALSPFALLGATLIAEMKKREIYIMQTTAPILKMILFFALIPFWGIWGVVAAIVIAETFSGLLSLRFFLKVS